MEKIAYNYSVSQYCMPERTTPKVSMAELFDMVAGTSTGSLLAVTLVIPSDTNKSENKFFASDAIDIYS
jgi:patatin-like phospholipase/acyl hydrolase